MPLDTQPVIAVIIVNYRTPELVIRGLGALEQERQEYPKLSVVIIDNHSGDDSLSLVHTAITDNHWGSWCKIIAAPKNGGYAYGNNLGFAEAKAWLDHIDYYWMLNPDTQVLPGATKALLKHLEAKPDTIVGSCLQDRDGTKQVSTFRFPSIINEMCSGFGLGLLDRLFKHKLIAEEIPSASKQCEWMAGASLMFSSQVQATLDDLDANYFLYFEEVDYLLKAHQQGIHCWYIPQSQVVHEVGASTGISDTRKKQPRRPQYWFASRRRYFLKNHGRLYLLAADALWLLGYGSWLTRKRLLKPKDMDLQPPFLWRDFFRASDFYPLNWMK